MPSSWLILYSIVTSFSRSLLDEVKVFPPPIYEIKMLPIINLIQRVILFF